MAGNEEDRDLDALALELRNDEYPLPEDKENKKQISYKNVDVTITFKKEEKKDAKTDEKRILFTDSGFELGALLFDEARGILRVPIVLAKEMVYDYDDYAAFRPSAELEAIAPYLKGVPVTRSHPEGTIVTDRKEVLGWAVDAEFEDDELRAVLEIVDKDLIADIQEGKLKGVSPGHFSRIDKTASGDYEGTHFDVTQRDIFIDHIAIVEEGRCSVADGCGIVRHSELKDNKKMEGDEEEIMEPKVVEKKVEAAIVVAENIEEKAEEEEKVLKEIVELKEEVPSAVLTKVKKAIGIAEKIGEEAKEKLVENLEKVKEAVTGPKEEKNEEGEKEEEKGDAGAEAVTDAVVKKLKEERDDLKVALDEIVEVEKEKLVDELSTLQDVKTERELKKMSLDALKGDLELVKALRGSKFTVDDDDGGEDSGAISKAYKGVGKGGKE
ncbi:prohead protease [ANMV-1 virus]|nr:prohead protease [ANMV-1 virus]